MLSLWLRVYGSGCLPWHDTYPPRMKHRIPHFNRTGVFMPKRFFRCHALSEDVKGYNCLHLIRIRSRTILRHHSLIMKRCLLKQMDVPCWSLRKLGGFLFSDNEDSSILVFWAGITYLCHFFLGPPPPPFGILGATYILFEPWSNLLGSPLISSLYNPLYKPPFRSLDPKPCIIPYKSCKIPLWSLDHSSFW